MRKDKRDKRFERILPENPYPPPILRRLRKDRIAEKRAFGCGVVPVQIKKGAHDAFKTGRVQTPENIAVRLLTDAQDQIAHDTCIAVRFRFEPESLSAVKGLAEIEIRISFQANPLGRFHNTHCPDSYSLMHAAGCTRRIRGEI